MFERITPEAAGIEGRYVREYLEFCQKHGLVMHSVLMMRGDRLFAEAYWKPFHKDLNHRMYSQTKSYVGIAIGLLEADGKLSLQDPIASFFPEKTERELPRYLREQTVREMLTMTTSVQYPYWFTAGDPDRTHLYLNGSDATHPAGSYWSYDSTGSQVLADLVEKLSGKTLLEFLRERIFRYLGTFQHAEILKTPSGASWGDSALLCTSRDMMSFARLLLNGGKWEGRQLIPEDYVREATRVQVANNVNGFDSYDAQGYGYQIWGTQDGGFSFHGMGGQHTICLPDKDLIFVCTGDNQGFPAAYGLIFSKFFDGIADHMGDAPLPEDPEEYRKLQEVSADLKLSAMKGNVTSETADRINGRTFLCRTPSPSGITRFRFDFKPDGTGEFRYTNAQGDKVLPFGLTENVFSRFPQFGYSDGVGGQRTQNGFLYQCAASAAWCDADRLVLKVQIIDRYFGNFTATFGFHGSDAGVFFHTTAEDFLKEYTGILDARME